jgi:hypothetical protein
VSFVRRVRGLVAVIRAAPATRSVMAGLAAARICSTIARKLPPCALRRKLTGRAFALRHSASRKFFDKNVNVVTGSADA